jgi:hypothetical protein
MLGTKTTNKQPENTLVKHIWGTKKKTENTENHIHGCPNGHGTVT